MKEQIKKLLRWLLGWYVEPVYQENERLREQMERLSEQIAGVRTDMAGHLVTREERFGELLSGTSQTEKRLNAVDERISGFEERETWTQGRIEEQDKRLSGLEERETWTQGRFEEQDKRFNGLEEREAWTRKRFEEHDKRFADLEGREAWTRGRFEEHDRRFSDLEGREGWTRKRFEGHDSDIFEHIRWLSEIEHKLDGRDDEDRQFGAANGLPFSRLCTARELLSPGFQKYHAPIEADKLIREIFSAEKSIREIPRYTRREWEFEVICKTLDELGLLADGKRGLGFAVGIETLPAYFASRGCSILATDLAPEDDTEGLWSGTNQNTMGNIQSLNQYGVCPEEEFEKLVTFRNVDMNHIPDDLRGYDFCWSTCAIEHVGDMEKSIQFLKNMLGTLKPGGVAIHTTEYNLSSDISTVESGDTVIFRDRDIRAVCRWMNENGHEIAVDLARGTEEMDLKKCGPGRDNTGCMLNWNILGYDSTSFAFIIRKGANAEG